VRLLLRLTLLAFAVAACGWFLLGERQASDLLGATAIVNTSGTPSRAEAARARSLLDSAATLNPDRSVDVLRGQLAVDGNQYRSAERIEEAVVRDEPMNIEAWVQLANAAQQRNDKRLLGLTEVRLGALEPKVK
jgi:hypothetical protein